MTRFRANISDEIDKQGIYPVLEDVLIAMRASATCAKNKEANIEWAAKVFDAVLCAFDLDYEMSSAADKVAALELAIENLEALIKAKNENK